MASPLLRRAEAPAAGALDRVVRLAVAEVTGCSGASATLWRDGDPAVFAASHPDLAELATIERSIGHGPVTGALATGRPVCSPDTLAEDRRPGYAAAALARGVRCCVTLVHRSGPAAVTLSLFGALPGQPGSKDPPLGRLVAVFGGVTPGRTAQAGPPEREPPGATGS